MRQCAIIFLGGRVIRSIKHVFRNDKQRRDRGTRQPTYILSYAPMVVKRA